MPDAASNPPPSHAPHAPLAAQAKPWWEWTACVPAAAAEDMGALLVDAGAMGAEVLLPAQFAERAWHRHASMGPNTEAARTAELGPAASDQVYLVASFVHAASPEAGPFADASSVAEAASDALGGLLSKASARTAAVEKRQGGAWAQAWREHFKPIKVGHRLWIVPSWCEDFAAPIGSCVLTIDPGMAFGTGQHATTSLCLKAIERFATERAASSTRASWRLLDVGAGTGILAIAGLLLGARDATLVDIDDDALAACAANLAVANVAARGTVRKELPGDGAVFDLVVANILANTLTDMMPALVSATAKGGRLLLSGVLAEQAHGVAQAVFRAGRGQGRNWQKTAQLQHENWVALAFSCD